MDANPRRPPFVSEAFNQSPAKAGFLFLRSFLGLMRKATLKRESSAAKPRGFEAGDLTDRDADCGRPDATNLNVDYSFCGRMQLLRRAAATGPRKNPAGDGGAKLTIRGNFNEKPNSNDGTRSTLAATRADESQL